MCIELALAQLSKLLFYARKLIAQLGKLRRVLLHDLGRRLREEAWVGKLLGELGLVLLKRCALLGEACSSRAISPNW